jgi:hypothetical protein
MELVPLCGFGSDETSIAANGTSLIVDWSYPSRSMPCWICLRGEVNAIMSNDSPDEVMRRIDAAGDAFITVAGIPMAHDDESRTLYVRASDITSVMPIHPREYEAELDDPPDWYTRYAPE